MNIAQLFAAQHDLQPDPSVPEQQVAFCTSGASRQIAVAQFQRAACPAISQAICQERARQGIVGPLFLGTDRHALSLPVFERALEMLAANGVQTMIAVQGEFTPTAAVSRGCRHARCSGLSTRLN